MEERHRTPPRPRRLTLLHMLQTPLLTLLPINLLTVSRGLKRAFANSPLETTTVYPPGRVQTACGCLLSRDASIIININKFIYVCIGGWTSGHLPFLFFFFSFPPSPFLFFFATLDAHVPTPQPQARSTRPRLWTLLVFSVFSGREVDTKPQPRSNPWKNSAPSATNLYPALTSNASPRSHKHARGYATPTPNDACGTGVRFATLVANKSGVSATPLTYHRLSTSAD